MTLVTEIYRQDNFVPLCRCAFVPVFLLCLTASGCISSIRPKSIIVARVDSYKITRDEFIEELKQFHLHHKHPGYARKADIPAFLNDMIDRRLFIQEAERMGLDQESGFQKALADEKGRLQDRQEADRQGQVKRKKVKEQLERYRQYLLYRTFLHKVIAEQVQVSDEEIERCYQDNPSLFRTDPIVYLERIEVRDPNSAYQIYQELLQGADFNFLAGEKSPKRANARLDKAEGWVSLKKIPPELRTVAGGLREGEISPPVYVGAGYSIFKVKRKKGGERIPLQKVRKQVEEKVASLKFRSTVQDWSRRLRKVSRVVIYENALQKLAPKYQP